MARKKKNLEPIDEAVRVLLNDTVERSGISHTAIGMEVGISQNRVSTILRGDTPPASVGELAMIASVVNVRISDLIYQAEREFLSELPRSLTPSEFDLAASTHEIEDEPDYP